MNKDYYKSQIETQKRIIEGLKHSISLIKQELKGVPPANRAGRLQHIEQKKTHIIICKEEIKNIKEKLKKAPK
jgi:hypothetical protein